MKKDFIKAAQNYREDLSRFLRDLIRIPSESCREEKVVERIKEEMERLGYEAVRVDGMGNILGRIGSGPKVIAMDGHVDTVGVANIDLWERDPYGGSMEKGIIYGLGASDQKGGVASLVYGGKIIKDLGAQSGCSISVVGSVQEEDCDGLCWQYMAEKENFRPDCVLLSEPTNLNVYRGHRGRMEIGVRVLGRSAHGSAPERGVNPVYLMNRLIGEIERMDAVFKSDPFLGKGSITLSHISSKSPSLCAVPGECYLHLDRRLTAGEERSSALAEIENAALKAGINAEITVPLYCRPGYTGLVHKSEAYFPTWVMDEDAPLVRAALNTRREVLGERGKAGKWIFSTNGVATRGILGIPTVGFGPGNEKFAHTVNDRISVDHLVKAAAFYAAFPESYARETDGKTKDKENL